MWVSYAVLVLAVRTTADEDSKIVGGHPINLRLAPFMVSLQKDGFHFCGGSVLTLSHVLSACHCLAEPALGMTHEEIRPRVPSQIKAVVGTENVVDTSRMAQMRNLHQIIIHPKCSYELILVYDFALGIVENPFIESLKVRPLTLPKDKMTFDKKTKALLREKKRCFVAGWGATVVNPALQVASSLLNAVQMRVIPDAECGQKLAALNSKFERFDFAGNAQLCTLSSGHQKNASDCSGDSGGPYFCGSQVYAVVSYGYECGQWDLPNVYAKLSYAVDWFRELNIPVMRPSELKIVGSTPVIKRREDSGWRSSGQSTMKRPTVFPLLILVLNLEIL